MRLRNAALFVLLLPGVAAAQLYKIVGPDGKITYSDRPPLTANGSVQIIKSGGPVPLAVKPVAPNTAGADVPAPAEAGRGTSGTWSAKHAIRSEHRNGNPDLNDGAAGNRVDLLKGLRVVLGNMTLVEQTSALCTSTLPTSFKRYDRAASLWKSRNGDVINQANAVLSSAFSGSERAQLEMAARQNTDSMLQVVRNADPARRIKWCDKSADDMSSGTLDLVRMGGVDVLMRYQAR
jgi:hypothetical protein